MQISEEGLNLIKHFEGFRSKPYLCPAGVPTIGYGTTVYTDGVEVTLKDPPIDEEDAALILQETLGSFEDCVNTKTKVTLTQHEFDALVSFSYNVGAGAFSKSTLLKLLNTGDYEGAADQLLRWNKGGGKVLPGLTARRQAERALFLKA